MLCGWLAAREGFGSLQTNCSKSFSDENRYLAIEQVSETVWTTATVHLCSNFHLLIDFYSICFKGLIKFNIKKICTRENRCLDRNSLECLRGLVMLPWAVSGFVIVVADKILKA